MNFSLLTTPNQAAPCDDEVQCFLLSVTNLEQAKSNEHLSKIFPLLQKKGNKPNTLLSFYQQETPFTLLTVDSQQLTAYPSPKGFTRLFQEVQNFAKSKARVHFIGFNAAEVNDLIAFLIREWSDFVYRFNHYQKKDTTQAKDPSHLQFIVEEESDLIKKTLKKAQVLAKYMKKAKDLENSPANLCTPKDLAHFARKEAQQLGIKYDIFTGDQIKEIGLHSFLSVAKGSEEAPYFVTLHYEGASNKEEAPVVLVGKGITFDSGGISLKPRTGMEEMKYDMCGAATVINTLFAAAELKLPINVVALVPTCENMPSGRANKPGDVVKSLKGLSIEVINTDAEGRLILCDALTYAERFKPQAVIYVATLTGACVIALGHSTSAVIGREQVLIDELMALSQKARDKIWQLPLWKEYGENLESNCADLANVGPTGAAGTITAAAFLSHFIDEAIPWAHIDIAGTGWKPGAHKLGTGRPIPLLLAFLEKRSQKQSLTD